MRRPRLTQGCSADRKEGKEGQVRDQYIIIHVLFLKEMYQHCTGMALDIFIISDLYYLIALVI